jgi:small conductance mechanosensitive channel
MLRTILSRQLLLLTFFAVGLSAALIPHAFAQENAEKAVLPSAVVNPQISTNELRLRLGPLTKSELEAAAKDWLAIVKARTNEVVEAQIAVSALQSEAADQMRERLVKLTRERNKLFNNYSAVVDSWEKKGGNKTAIADYRAYRSAIIIEQARTADFGTLWKAVLNWMTLEDGGVRLLKRVATVAIAILALIFVARIIRRFIGHAVMRIPNISKLLQAFLVMTVYWLVLAIGLMVVLSALGVDVSPVFALIGGASFILAFAMQSTLGNLAAGLMIMIYHPFDEGDYVDLAGVSGTVKSVSIVSTTVATPDNRVVLVPNSNVWNGVITNVTTSETRRVDLTFGIGYDDSIESAQNVLEEIVVAHPLVLKDPPPVIRVAEISDHSINFIVRPWVLGKDYWTVYWDLTRQVKEGFDKHGISIPYPQRDIHIRQHVQQSV